MSCSKIYGHIYIHLTYFYDLRKCMKMCICYWERSCDSYIWDITWMTMDAKVVFYLTDMPDVNLIPSGNQTWTLTITIGKSSTNGWCLISMFAYQMVNKVNSSKDLVRPASRALGCCAAGSWYSVARGSTPCSVEAMVLQHVWKCKTAKLMKLIDTIWNCIWIHDMS